MENHQLSSDNPMILEIRELLEKSRKNIAQQVNTELLTTYWNIGRIIVEYEQQSQLCAEYGKQTLKELSKELTREFGKGFSRSNLQKNYFHTPLSILTKDTLSCYHKYIETNRKGDECPAYQMSHNRWHGYGWRRVDKINSIA